MDECIFCRIVAGELPASKVYEDDALVAFMDIFPCNPGHVLIAPKQHYAQLRDVPENVLMRLIQAVSRIEKAIWNSGIPCEGTNLLQNNGTVAGQDVHHVHFHVIPRVPGDGLRFRFPSRKATRAELDEIADKLRRFLQFFYRRRNLSFDPFRQWGYF